MARWLKRVVLALLAAALLAAGYSVARPFFYYDPYKTQGTAACISDLQVKLRIGQHYNRIRLWRQNTPEDGELPTAEPGEGYVFLPAGAVLKDVSFLYDETAGSLWMNGTALNSGSPIKGLEPDTTALLEWKGADGTNEALDVTFMQSAHYASIYLNTQSGTTEQLRTDKALYEPGQMTMLRAGGKLEYRGEVEKFGGRGNHSWRLNKRGWSFKLPRAVSLLDFAPNKSYILLANAYDDSNGLRNQIVYTMAKENGEEYAREIAFVDLYLNEVYAGTYQLAEKVDVGENALNIGDLDDRNREANPDTYAFAEQNRTVETDGDGSILRSYSDLVTPEDHSGGYLIERNFGYKLEEKPYSFTTQNREGFVVRSPSAVNETELDYIAQTVERMENALLSPTLTDPETGLYYTRLLDLNSWVKKYLVDEISKNEGAGVTSCFYYKKQGDPLLYAGPSWDYDKSLGRFECWQNPLGLASAGLYDKEIAVTLYWERFYELEDARAEIIRQYKAYYSPWVHHMLENRLSGWAEELRASYRMNAVRWKNDIESYPYPEYKGGLQGKPGDLDASVAYLQSWLTERVAFLDSLWIDGDVWCRMKDVSKRLRYSPYRYMYTKAGEPAGEQLAAGMQRLEEMGEEEVPYWVDIYAETEAPITPDTIITEDINLEPVYIPKQP